MVHLDQRSLAIVGALVLVGCASAQQHRAAVTESTDRVTVGTVQRNIRVGMSSYEVVSAPDSPNIVTTDDLRREQWVYAKVGTDTVYSASSGA